MRVDEHLDGLRSAGQRLAEAAEAAGPDAKVPSCPEWVVRDLVRHQGGVHRWATGHITGPRSEPWDVELDEVVGAWPDDANLIAWFADGHAALIQALADADPALVCWTFLTAPSPLAMWSRRQAHETTIHRIDAELAAGWQPAVIPAGFAADGVDELLAAFITRPGGKLRAEPAVRLRVSCTDDPGAWLVSIEPDRVVTTTGADAGPPADCAVTGTASDLYQALWNRLPAGSLAVEGDQDVFGLFAERVKVRWS